MFHFNTVSNHINPPSNVSDMLCPDSSDESNGSGDEWLPYYVIEENLNKSDSDSLSDSIWDADVKENEQTEEQNIITSVITGIINQVCNQSQIIENEELKENTQVSQSTQLTRWKKGQPNNWKKNVMSTEKKLSKRSKLCDCSNC